MKQTLVLIIAVVAMSCQESDNRRRTPDPRFATKGCINDTTDQELFDANGKAYYEYVPCGSMSDSPPTTERYPCDDDSMETERFDEKGNAYIMKVPCPD